MARLDLRRSQFDRPEHSYNCEETSEFRLPPPPRPTERPELRDANLPSRLKMTYVPDSTMLVISLNQYPPYIPRMADANGNFTELLRLSGRPRHAIARHVGPNWSAFISRPTTISDDSRIEIDGESFYGEPKLVRTSTLVRSRNGAVQFLSPELIEQEAASLGSGAVEAHFDVTGGRVMRYADTHTLHRWHVYEQVSLIALTLGASGLVALVLGR